MEDKKKSPKGDGGLVDVLKPIAIRIQNGSTGSKSDQPKPSSGKR